MYQFQDIFYLGKQLLCRILVYLRTPRPRKKTLVFFKLTMHYY